MYQSTETTFVGAENIFECSDMASTHTIKKDVSLRKSRHAGIATFSMDFTNLTSNFEIFGSEMDHIYRDAIKSSLFIWNRQIAWRSSKSPKPLASDRKIRKHNKMKILMSNYIVMSQVKANEKQSVEPHNYFGTRFP